MKKNRPLILVTNDDGINAPGIRLLISIAKQFGRVIVAAPDSAQSAKSHSITIEGTLSYKKIEKTEQYAEYAISGTPVDCVKLAIHELTSEKPDLILSGINHGTNTSASLIYSGTMAAAIEGSMNGIHSVGFSVCHYDTYLDFAFTKPYIEKIITKVLENGLGQGTSLNVNFPVVEAEPIKGVKICRTAVGFWAEEFIPANHPHNKPVFWLSGGFTNLEPDAEDTDDFAIQSNYVSVTPVKVDFTDYKSIKQLKNWNL